jgi:hypothetical protein
MDGARPLAIRCTVPVATPNCHRDLAHAHIALLQGGTDTGLGLWLDPGPTDRLAAASAASCRPGHYSQHPFPDHPAPTNSRVLRQRASAPLAGLGTRRWFVP